MVDKSKRKQALKKVTKRVNEMPDFTDDDDKDQDKINPGTQSIYFPLVGD